MTTNPRLAAKNTDRELWREESGLPADPDNYYAPSIHVTAQGGVGINVGGTVIVKTLREWHSLALTPATDDAVTPEMRKAGLDAWYAKADSTAGRLENIYRAMAAASLEAVEEGHSITWPPVRNTDLDTWATSSDKDKPDA